MEIEWFGWLTKAHLQVSALDHVVMLGELLVLILFFALLDFLIKRIK